jgi:hypothetical protein
MSEKRPPPATALTEKHFRLVLEGDEQCCVDVPDAATRNPPVVPSCLGKDVHLVVEGGEDDTLRITVGFAQQDEPLLAYLEQQSRLSRRSLAAEILSQLWDKFRGDSPEGPHAPANGQ